MSAGIRPSRAHHGLALATGLGVIFSTWLAYGVTPIGLGIYAIYFVTVIALPGVAIWHFVVGSWRRRNGIRGSAFQDWVCGTILGYIIEIPCYLLARWLGYPRAYVVVPLAVLALTSYFANRSRRNEVGSRGASRLTSLQAWSFTGLIAFVVVWFAVMNYSVLPLAAGSMLDPDEMFQLALVGELRHHWPATYPYMLYDGPLTYQFFVHVHMAASTWATGLPPDLIYRRFDPLILSALTVLGTGVVATRLSGRGWTGPLASGILVLVGAFDVTGAKIGEAAAEERFLLHGVLVHSPTQTFAFALAIPAIVVAVDVLTVRGDWRVWALLGVILVSLTGAKVTFVPMFACGFLAVMIMRSIRRRRVDWPSLLGLGLSSLSVLWSTLVLYRAQSQSLEFSPLQTTEHFMTQFGMAAEGIGTKVGVTLALLVMWLMPGAGIVGLLIHKPWDVRFWWLAGATVSGLGATLLLGHVGSSQVYFGRSSAPLIAALSAWGLTLLFEGASIRARRTGALVAISAGAVLYWVRLFTESWRESLITDGEAVETPVLRIWMNLPVFLGLLILTWLVAVVIRDVSKGAHTVPLRIVVAGLVGLGLARSMAFVTGHYDDPDFTDVNRTFGQSGRSAAEWLMANSGPDDRVMTNVHCGPAWPQGSGCDARHFWMSALSQRRFLIEGWAYTARSGDWTNPFWGNRALLQSNDQFFREPSAATLARAMKFAPTDWLFVDTRGQVSMNRLLAFSGAAVAYTSGPYWIFRVGEPTRPK